MCVFCSFRWTMEAVFSQPSKRRRVMVPSSARGVIWRPSRELVASRMMLVLALDFLSKVLPPV